jgi:hypothetical protein
LTCITKTIKEDTKNQVESMAAFRETGNMIADTLMDAQVQ